MHPCFYEHENFSKTNRRKHLIISFIWQIELRWQEQFSSFWCLLQISSWPSSAIGIIRKNKYYNQQLCQKSGAENQKNQSYQRLNYRLVRQETLRLSMKTVVNIQKRTLISRERKKKGTDRQYSPLRFAWHVAPHQLGKRYLSWLILSGI